MTGQRPVTKGMKVRLVRDFAGRQGTIPAGHTGHIAFSDGDCVGVKFDQPVEALEDWGNVLHFYGDHGPDNDPEHEVTRYCEVV